MSACSIPNAICFSPDTHTAYWTDTATGIVMQQALDPETGWPSGDSIPWLDLSTEAFGPDGAVVDAEGNFWNAQWGAGRVAAYTPEGTFLRAISTGAAHTTCPAFGGPDLTTMFCTSATQGLEFTAPDDLGTNGMTFAAEGVAKGQAEHRVLL